MEISVPSIGNEELLIHELPTQSLNRQYVDFPDVIFSSKLFFKTRPLYLIPWFRVDLGESLKDSSCPCKFVIPLLKLDVCTPRSFIRFPRHPPLKHLPGARDITQRLFHVNMFIPQFIHQWQNGNRTVKQVPGMIYIPGLHLRPNVP